MPGIRKAILLTMLMAAGSAGPASADELYDKCMAQSDGSNMSWQACGGEWLEREDERLNAAWQKMLAETEGETKADLIAEQRLWNAYKESACNFHGNGEWGREGQVLEFPACRAGVIATRTKELEEYGRFFAGGN